MILLQIASDTNPIMFDGALSANWALVVAVGIIGFFLIRAINRFDKTVEDYGKILNDHETRIKIQETITANYTKMNTQAIVDEIFTKIDLIKELKKI